jgi:hypothetical protein
MACQDLLGLKLRERAALDEPGQHFPRRKRRILPNLPTGAGQVSFRDQPAQSHGFK